MKLVLAIVAALAFSLFARSALASPRLHFVEEGPLVLEPTSGSWVSSITAENAGDGTLVISRVSVRDADVDPALARVHAGFAGGATRTELGAGQRTKLEVVWSPPKDARAVRGYVVVVSNDPAAREQAFAFRAESAHGSVAEVLRRLLAFLLLFPAAGALAVAMARNSRSGRMVALVAACLTAATAWGVVRSIHPMVGQASLALPLRVVLSRGAGVELYLGVDGGSLPSIAAVGLLLPIGVILTPRHASVALSAMLGLGTTVLLALLSLDACVTTFALAASAALVVVLARASNVGVAAERRFALGAVVGAVAFAIAIVLLRQSADPGLLATGDAVSSPWSATELGRTAFLAKHAPVTVAWSLMFVGAVAFGVPLLSRQFFDEERPHVTFAVGALFLRVGPHLLVRWAIPLMPEATRWAAPVVVTLSVAMAALIGLRGLAGGSATKLASAIGVGSLACFAAGLALTPQGFAALTLYGALAGTAMAFALVTRGSLRTLALVLVASGGVVGVVLALVAISSRSPGAALVLALAVVGSFARHSASAHDPLPRPHAFAAALTAVVLVVLSASAVDFVAPSARAMSERIVRAGGDLLGA